MNVLILAPTCSSSQVNESPSAKFISLPHTHTPTNKTLRGPERKIQVRQTRGSVSTQNKRMSACRLLQNNKKNAALVFPKRAVCKLCSLCGLVVPKVHIPSLSIIIMQSPFLSDRRRKVTATVTVPPAARGKCVSRQVETSRSERCLLWLDGKYVRAHYCTRVTQCSLREKNYITLFFFFSPFSDHMESRWKTRAGV